MKLVNKVKLIKVFSWLKEYWYIPLLCVVFILAVLLLPKKRKVAHQIIEYMRKKEKRVRKFNREVDEETDEKLKEVEKTKNKILEKIESDYEDEKESLVLEKKEKYLKELDKVKEDPKALEDWFNNYLSNDGEG